MLIVIWRSNGVKMKRFEAENIIHFTETHHLFSSSQASVYSKLIKVASLIYIFRLATQSGFSILYEILAGRKGCAM